MNDIPYPTNDVGNGMRFVRDHQQHVRWLIDEQEWVVWEGTHWRRYRTDEKVIALAKLTAATVINDAARIDNPKESARLTSWATQSQNAPRLMAMVKMAKSDSRLWSSGVDFDQNVYLLNFTNGSVDLRTGALKAHDPSDMISCLVPHQFNDAATAPLWEKLIERCVQVDPSGETAEFLTRTLGYMMLGRNIEQRIVFFVGPKRTGKSKIVEIVAQALGTDYAWVSQPKLITRSRWGTHHDSETWSIRGKRYVCISETDAAMDLDEAVVKNLTGASTLSMRRLHSAGEVQAFVTWSIIVGTNEEPNVERWDDAIARRTIKIPSGPSLDPSEVDLDLEDKILRGEVEGVLSSLVAGAVRWYQRRQTEGTGLGMPAAVERATREFENSNDHVAEFIDARVDVGDGYTVLASDVNKAYQAHRGKGGDSLKSRALYGRIIEYFKERQIDITKDARFFYGFHLADEKAAAVEPWMTDAARHLATSWKVNE